MINNIQALRALAAILILLFHTAGHYASLRGGNIYLDTFNKMGFVGVDVFFVISGFVIALTTTHKPRNATAALNFIHNRAARIYFGYWPFLLMMIALYAVYEPAVLHNTRALTKSIFLYSPNTKHILSVAWTLNYELYFYLCFVPLFWLGKTYLPRCMAILFTIILFRCLFISAKPHSYFEFFSSPYLLEFLSGSLLYHYQFLLLKRRFIIPLITVIIAGTAAGVCYNYSLGFSRVHTFGISAVSLVWLGLLLDKENIFRASQYWTNLGNASYTIYLSHIIFLLLFSYSGCRDWLNLQHPFLINMGFIALITGVIVFSTYFHKHIEAPLYYKLHRS